MGSSMGKGGGHILDALPSQGTLHVAMLGLDSAGKTTALYRLKFDQYLNTVPTIGFNCEKVYGTVGKAKGVQFLVWDVGGQEKLRPLWRSYTRCTDGILFVVDSVDFERMEEAKMELMRTAKSPENQGVPVLILANKQDLPGARDPKQLEKLLGLSELVPIYSTLTLTSMGSCSSSKSIVGGSTSILSSSETSGNSQKISDASGDSAKEMSNTNSSSVATTISPGAKDHKQIESLININHLYKERYTYTTKPQPHAVCSSISPSSVRDSNPTTSVTSKSQQNILSNTMSSAQSYFKGWYIQPACAITGEGLQEGLEALYEMILRRRKISKTQKRKKM